MFSDFSTEVVEFPSCWRTVKKHSSSSTQTGVVRTQEADCQTKRPRHAECQTETLLQLMQESLSLHNSTKQNETSLIKFLRAVEPLVTKQLEVNITAAKFFTDVFKRRERESEVGISCTYMLDEDSVTSTQETDCVEVTSVSWSCTGATLAVAYGTHENIAWSENRSYLCLWNLDRPRLNRRASDQKLELESSIQVIAFHPQLPGYLAAGLFSGAVLIWDLAMDDVIYSSSSHEDPVTCLCWLEEKNPKYLRLVSASSDGRMIVWKHKKVRETFPIKIEKHFKIRGTNLARWSGVRGAVSVGITCLSVASEHLRDELLSDRGFSTSNTMLVGCEAGAVVKCNLDADDSNPVIFTYESHVGPVYTVDWSPFHRHLFLTCSTDQTCRIYHSLQATALREIRPQEAAGGREANYLFAARWSPSRPRVFFTVGTRGRVEACDAISSQSLSFCDAADREGRPCVINDLSFNPSRRNIFASGSSSGLAHVWELGSMLFESEDLPDEVDRMGALADEALTHD